MLGFKQFLQEELKRIQGQLGSNAGGVYHDTETGEKHYIKFPENPDQAKTEVLSSKLQQLMGINTLNPELKEMDGKLGVATKWHPKLTTFSADEVKNFTPEQHHELGKIYAHGILTRNHDCIGNGLKYGDGNVVLDHKGKLHSLDQGGSFEYRARGNSKPYESDVSEIHTFKDPSINPESAKVFNTTFRMTPEAERHGYEAVKNLDDEKVHEAFRNSGLSNWEKLHDTFKKRKQNYLDHYEK